MKHAESTGHVITLVFSIICAALLARSLLEGYEKDKNKFYVFFVAPIINITYTVMYIVVIVKLNRIMAKMDGDLRT